jgi:hypothetical protein
MTPETMTRDILMDPYFTFGVQFYHVSTIDSGLDNKRLFGCICPILTLLHLRRLIEAALATQ